MLLLLKKTNYVFNHANVQICSISNFLRINRQLNSSRFKANQLHFFENISQPLSEYSKKFGF